MLLSYRKAGFLELPNLFLTVLLSVLTKLFLYSYISLCPGLKENNEKTMVKKKMLSIVGCLC